ncbi:MAG: hypothetical protein M3R62_01830 [Acidobacteriota bacterium]|nr:hypothetical protein [Acidobacteriota bacterium]
MCGPLIGGAFLAQAIAAALDVEFAFTERVMPAVSDGLYPAVYRLPPAFAPRVRGLRIAIVDDVMSAGSAARGTYAELQAHGAKPVVIGALLVLGSAGEDFFARQSVAVEAVARRPYRLWTPAECPLCDSGVPLEAVAVRNQVRQAPEERGKAAATTDFIALSSPGERTPDRPPAASTLPAGRLRGPRRDQR